VTIISCFEPCGLYPTVLYFSITLRNMNLALVPITVMLGMRINQANVLNDVNTSCGGPRERVENYDQQPKRPFINLEYCTYLLLRILPIMTFGSCCHGNGSRQPRGVTEVSRGEAHSRRISFLKYALAREGSAGATSYDFCIPVPRQSVTGLAVIRPLGAWDAENAISLPLDFS
jgi:hypothetical protein